MSQDSPSIAGVGIPPVPPAAPDAGSEMPERVYLVSYPKIVFLYPTVLTSLFCAIVMWAKGGLPAEEFAAQASLAPHASPSEMLVTGRPMMKASLSTQDAAATPPASTDAAAANSEASTASAASTESETPAITMHSYHNVCARVFLIVFALNMVVISFDFPRTTSLTWFFAIVAIVLGLWFLLSSNPGLAPKIVHGLLAIKPAANASFYMIYTIIMLFLYGWVMISRRFDYWEVKGNELLHHHGFLSNLERFSAPNLRIDKEINDLFEYMLLRSGRLIIHASNERRAIVLENVLAINSKEDRITKMLGALQVRVRTDKE